MILWYCYDFVYFVAFWALFWGGGVGWKTSSVIRNFKISKIWWKHWLPWPKKGIPWKFQTKIAISVEIMTDFLYFGSFWDRFGGVWRHQWFHGDLEMQVWFAVECCHTTLDSLKMQYFTTVTKVYIIINANAILKYTQCSSTGSYGWGVKVHPLEAKFIFANDKDLYTIG